MSASVGVRGADQICGMGGNGGKGSRVMWKEYGGRGLGRMVHFKLFFLILKVHIS